MNNKFWLPLLASVYTACNKAVALRSSLQFNRVLHKRIIMSALVHSSDGKVDVLSGDSTDATVLKPIAKSIPHDVYYGINPNDLDELRGDAPMDPPKIRSDPFYWLRDQTRSDKEVLAHLEHENKYCEQELSHLAGLRGSLYDEMISHLKETDEDVPHRHGDYMYYSKTSKGLSYTIHCRKAIAASVDSSSISSSCSSDVVILDENKLAEEHDYTDVGMLVPSPSHNRVAYTVDHSGYETYSLRVIEDVETNRCSEDVIEDVDSTIVWGADDSVLFYLTLDDQHRPHKLFLHRLGTKQEDDLCLFTESDDKFWMSIGKTNDDKFLILSLSSTETSECYAIDLTDAEGATSHADAVIDRMVCLRKREFGVRYDVEHHGSHFYFVTNIDHAKNNKLMRSPSANYSSTTAWKDVRPYQAHEQIDDIIPFKNHIAVLGRESGIQRLWIMKMMIIDEQNGEEEQLLQWEAVPFPEITYSIHDGDNYVYDSSVIRLTYTSLVTPKQTLDYDMSTGEVTILKQTEVPLYDRDSYECRRIVATVRDGTQVPMSMVYHKKILQGECQRRLVDNPVLLYGYGSYGVCIDPSFDFKRISLLDRGVVFVIAHIRGGGEMGRSWYEDEGKYLKKMNTFHDFIDCAHHLVDEQITTRDRLAIVGRSAGGLLVGAVCNLSPQSFKAAVADVPFVDVMNSMSDPTIPLTVTEWEEWGNPNEEKYYSYMESYSPYDNVKAQDYPAMLVTAGLNDPRVAYWEPAKWVSKLRQLKTDDRPLVLKTDLSSGHFSASDRYKFIHETAFEYAFILDQITSPST